MSSVNSFLYAISFVPFLLSLSGNLHLFFVWFILLMLVKIRRALYLQVPSLICLIPSSVSLISSKISTFKSLTTFFKLPHSPGDMMPFCSKMSSTLTTSSMTCSLGVVRKSLQFCRHLGHASPINTVTENCNSIRTLSFVHSMCKTILCNHKINCWLMQTQEIKTCHNTFCDKLNHWNCIIESRETPRRCGSKVSKQTVIGRLLKARVHPQAAL